MPKIDDPSVEAPFSYEGLDRVIHEKARLGLMTSLVAHPKGLAFGDLRALCGLTDGNLSRHLQVLAEAGLVEIIKGYDRNRPLTTCRLTALGRQKFWTTSACWNGSYGMLPQQLNQSRTDRCPRRGGIN